ncbi:zinc-binding dehydrogenase [Catenulispora sp. NF23]|uniref:Zinc-binding dehydrogenase n=1 Tax=Catenulispora pinistramenti TaxID=2705254 RepID=A0ABS5L0L1_9ACTN|nr:zinc-binding dehydrogenase [Catenulispora pinistramenti]MBS2551870.1 zinc-binding dehydrogenase [Catenulispora pinistramenti]
MRAVVVERFGDPSGMVVRDVADPVPDAGRVLVRTEAIGVGGVDAVIRRGALGSFGFEPGLIPGNEVAGTVTAVGDGVDASWIGRRVWAFTGTTGGYVELATTGVEHLTVLPEGLSSIDAVTLGSSGPVAHFALSHAHFAAGESVLIRGAAGSIGIAAVELASQGGAKVVAVTTSSAQRGRRLRELGATVVLDRTGQPDDGSHSGNGSHGESDAFDVIIDIVGGEAIPTFIDRLAPNGRMVVVGVVGGMPSPDFGMALMRSFRKSLSFAAFSLDTVPVGERDIVRAAQFDAAASGGLHPVVHSVLNLDQAADAHRQMDDGTVFGRIVLTP